jgi:hypothetical protein
MADRIERVVGPLLAAVDRAFPGGYSAVLYGSAARGDFSEATSDINLLLVLDDVSPPVLRTLGPAFTAWQTATPEPPLLISLGEWGRATDVFPVELTDMLASYKVLRGPDPLAGVSVPQADLRRELESELRGKLLRLRQGYTLLANDPDGLGALALRSAPTALVFCRAMLVLAGAPVSSPADAERVVHAAAGVVGFRPDEMLEVVRRRGQREWRCESVLFEGYLDAVARIAMFVDQLQPGDD